LSALAALVACALMLGMQESVSAQGTAPLAIQSVWVPTGNMSVARVGNTATLLPNGKVLVTGGVIASTPSRLDSAELYDPASGTWSMTGSMNLPRFGHTATLLADGRVLVVGGILYNSDFLGFNTAELYDPATGTWALTGNLSITPLAHTATLLQNGKVLVVDGNYNKVCELYDPSSGTWSATGSLNVVRTRFTATLVHDGRVLVARGTNATDFDGGAISSLSSAELYDPASGNWTLTASSLAPSVGHTATLLPSGKVLVAGGVSDDYAGAGGLTDSELFDPVTGTWTQTAPLTSPHSYYTATLLPNGNVLVAAGDATGMAAEQFDPIAGTWSSVSSLNNARFGPTATLLLDGRVLVAGGGTVSAELYAPLAPPVNSYRMTALFSDQAGLYQLIQLDELSGLNEQQHLRGLTLTSTSRSGVAKTFVFPDDLPSSATARTHVLIGTVAPQIAQQVDFTLPYGFLPTEGGTLVLGGFDAWSYAALPADGRTTLLRNNVLIADSCNKAPGFVFQSFSHPALGLTVFADPAFEYYNQALDHYFMSASQPDIDALDSGRISGWERTGESLPVWITSFNCLFGFASPPNLVPVCRLYIPPADGNSHFFSASADECSAAQTLHPQLVLETSKAFYASLPDPQTGACLYDQIPVYRVWNGRADSNHRYTVSLAIRDQMLSRGYVKEGYGPEAVAMCVGGGIPSD
jgi:hypothetical protein